MISLNEQGFFKRNWGKLALGGGALAFAASRGEDMGMGSAGEATGARLGRRAQSMIRGDSPAIAGIKNIAKDPNAALQKTAAAVGSGVRKGVDVGRETVDSVKRGYSGSAQSPNLPDVRKQSLPGGITGSGASADYNTRKPNVPFTPTRPESVGRAAAYKQMGAPTLQQRVQNAGEEIGRRGTAAGQKVQNYLRTKFPSTYAS